MTVERGWQEKQRAEVTYGQGWALKTFERGWMGSGAEKGTFKALVIGDNKLY